jgi:hypothetical protein
LVSFWPARTHWTQSWLFRNEFWQRTVSVLPSEPSPLTALRPKLRAMMDDARSDPDVSQKLEVFAFVEKALANLKAKEDNSESQE